MKIYNSAVDEWGDVYQGRTVLFIPKKYIGLNGEIQRYSSSPQRETVKETGYVFVIDEAEISNLHKYKIINGELHRK